MLHRAIQRHIFLRFPDRWDLEAREWWWARSYWDWIRINDGGNQYYLLGRVPLAALYMWKFTKKAIIFLGYRWILYRYVIDGSFILFIIAKCAWTSDYGIPSSRTLLSFCVHPNHPRNPRETLSRIGNCCRWRQSSRLKAKWPNQWSLLIVGFFLKLRISTNWILYLYSGRDVNYIWHCSPHQYFVRNFPFRI